MRAVVIAVVVLGVAFAPAGSAAPAAMQSCTGFKGNLLVDRNGEHTRFFVSESGAFALEDDAGHRVDCFYSDGGGTPATPQNTKNVLVKEGPEGIVFDGAGGAFGSPSIKAVNVGPVMVIGTPGADQLRAGCPIACRRSDTSFVRFDSATIEAAKSAEIFGGAGDDDIRINVQWRAPAHGGDGNDTLQLFTRFHKPRTKHLGTLFGDDGNDTLTGSSGDNMLFGGDGNDSIVGQAGNDALDGGGGNDTLDGGEGHDRLEGGAGSDAMAGGPRGDTFYAVDGTADFLDGGDGIDEAFIDKGLDSTNSIEHIH